MRLPPLRDLAATAGLTFRRFPLVLVSAAVATLSGLVLLEQSPPGRLTVLQNVALAGVLGIPLLLAAALACERRGWKGMRAGAVQGGALILLAAYAFSLPSDVATAPMLHLYRFWLLLIGLHLCVAWLPFVRRDGDEGFWRFNTILLVRLLLAALYACVLYGGLALALFSLDKLFGMTIVAERYLQLWYLIAGIFTPWYFLAGVPLLPVSDAGGRYPAGLKVFGQFVLLPIVGIYLVILYAYGIRILAAWEWPEGWVANLILGFSVTGVFALLLLWPLRIAGASRWVAVFARGFFVALLPLLVLLLLAVWRRISEYGVTENRYAVVLAGLWLALLAAWYLLGRQHHPRFIPVTLSAVTLLSGMGPWSLFSVAEATQVARLTRVMERGGLLVDGVVRRPASPSSHEVGRELSALLRYLGEMHGLARLNDWEWGDRREALAAILKEERGGQPRRAVELLGLEFVDAWEGMREGWVRFAASRNDAVPVAGYHALFRRVSLDLQGDTAAPALQASGVRYAARLDSTGLVVARLGTDSAAVRFPLLPLLDRLAAHPGRDSLPPEELAVEGSDGTLRVRVAFAHITARAEGGRRVVDRVSGEILVGGVGTGTP